MSKLVKCGTIKFTVKEHLMDAPLPLPLSWKFRTLHKRRNKTNENHSVITYDQFQCNDYSPIVIGKCEKKWRESTAIINICFSFELIIYLLCGICFSGLKPAYRWAVESSLTFAQQCYVLELEVNCKLSDGMFIEGGGGFFLNANLLAE